MLIEHRGTTPRVDPSAYVAPTAVLCGAVRVGPEARILFGAMLTAEDGEVVVGARMSGFRRLCETLAGLQSQF